MDPVFRLSERRRDNTYDINKLRIVNNTVANTTSRLFNNNVRVADGVIRNNIFHNIPVTVDSYRASVWGDFDHNLWNNVNLVVYSWETDPIVGPTDIVDADPLFFSEAQKDYHLTSQSPAIDTGLDIGLPFAGNAPDMGAYEYGCSCGGLSSFAAGFGLTNASSACDGDGDGDIDGVDLLRLLK